jgi:hypothetical protein
LVDDAPVVVDEEEIVEADPIVTTPAARAVVETVPETPVVVEETAAPKPATRVNVQVTTDDDE